MTALQMAQIKIGGHSPVSSIYFLFRVRMKRFIGKPATVGIQVTQNRTCTYNDVLAYCGLMLRAVFSVSSDIVVGPLT